VQLAAHDVEVPTYRTDHQVSDSKPDARMNGVNLPRHCRNLLG